MAVMLTGFVWLIVLPGGAPVSACPNPVAALTTQLDPLLRVEDAAVDAEGSLYLAGAYCGSADFDPSPNEFIIECTDFLFRDAFVAKYDQNVALEWVHHVAGDGGDVEIGSVSVAENGDVWAYGYFEGPTAFNPAQPEDISSAFEGYNVFLSHLSPQGEHLDTLVWQADEGEMFSRNLTVSSGDVYMTSSFSGIVDFDPSESSDFHVSQSTRNIFVMKLSEAGSYEWTRSFGGGGNDSGSAVAVDPWGNVIVTGTFRSNSVDFDPGPGTDLHFRQGQIEDIFVTKFTSDGDYVWTRTYPLRYPGGNGRVVVDGVGNMYFATAFRGTVDMDPTAGEDFITAFEGTTDIVVTKLHPDGSYGGKYAIVGTGSTNSALNADVDENGVVYITGLFKESIDFDAGPGESWHTAVPPNYDTYILALTSEFQYLWSRTIGNTHVELPRRVQVHSDGSLCLVGTFNTQSCDGCDPVIDLDPGCPVVNHTGPVPDEETPFVVRLHCPVTNGDSNGDGQVNLSDVAALQKCFTGADSSDCDSGCPALDLDGDDDIDLDDYGLFNVEFGDR